MKAYDPSECTSVIPSTVAALGFTYQWGVYPSPDSLKSYWGVTALHVHP